MANVQRIFDDAVAALNNQKLLEAERLFGEVLKIEKKHIASLNLLTIVLMNMKRFREAEEFISRAVKLNQSSDVSFYNYGLISKRLNKPHQALEHFDKALRLKKNVPETWNNRGTILNDLKRYEEAILDFDQAIALNANYSEPYANKAKALFELKRYEEACAVYDKALALTPDLAEAWLGRGNVYTELKRYDEAFAAYDKALALKPDLMEALLGRGKTFADVKRHEGALAAYEKALVLKPDLAEAWLGRGNVYTELKRYEESCAAYDKALALKPDLAEAWLGRGNVYTELKRYDEAFAAYDKALACKPDLEGAWLGRGNVYTALRHYDEAFAAYDKALARKPDLEGAWLGRGDVYAALKHYDEAFAAYDKALALEPDLENAWLGRGKLYTALKRYDEAFAAYDKALVLKPDLAEGWLGRGSVFYLLKRHDEALAACDKALALKPHLAGAWFARGCVLTEFKRYDEAFAAYDKAFVLDPDLPGIEGFRLHTKMHSCDWSDFGKDSKSLLASAKNQKDTLPWILLSIHASAQQQLEYATLWALKNYPVSCAPIWKGEIYKNKRIRVGYLSSDLRSHAVAYLMAGIFESHDRRRFETFALSTGHDDKSTMRDRLTRAFDQFIDVSDKSDREIADQIRALDIDILVDLIGYTSDPRAAILAQRPAPVQVAYLGYAATTGASFVDYLIADRTVIPPSHQMHYMEKIVYLPNSYLPHDIKGRQISDKPLMRSDFDLPKSDFVFCCFNNAYKINPEVFQSWMTIMKATDGSVLWLSELHETAQSNLKKKARAAGVDPRRLVFAKRLALAAEHLARHQLADLFLDTTPYNAHTTASDALWAGLPVLTQLGEAFAGRVVASLLNTIGLPELIARSQTEYEKLAIGLANSPANLRKIREQLKTNRLTSPLFDTRLFTRHLEGAYEAMYRRYQAGLAPDHITVEEIEDPETATGGELVVSEVE
jgi:protein O-GlcNAc transferase